MVMSKNKAPRRINVKHARIGGHVVVRVAEGKFIFYSSVVDAPITYVCNERETRRYMKAAAVKENGDYWKQSFDVRWECLQECGTTEIGFGRSSATFAIQGNRTGPNYEQMTLDAIARKYASRRAEKNFVPLEGDIIPRED